MNDIVMARTSLFRPPASPPARQPARIRQSNNQFFPSENLVKKGAEKDDDWSLELLQRIASVMNLPAADAVYHHSDELTRS
ncbi:hypothetical protein DPMN_111166 [Dreissena polymorpha]|uniref:Uncharacterized protein n=1 Tax=Dreissena polymorpha TaxID=45954 RepID=A0A9D4QPM1_DREPO|nr:hypothetical protein DPMN_111166 [Dreissena polymorpha]